MNQGRSDTAAKAWGTPRAESSCEMKAVVVGKSDLNKEWMWRAEVRGDTKAVGLCPLCLHQQGSMTVRNAFLCYISWPRPLHVSSQNNFGYFQATCPNLWPNKYDLQCFIHYYGQKFCLSLPPNRLATCHVSILGMIVLFISLGPCKDHILFWEHVGGTFERGSNAQGKESMTSFSLLIVQTFRLAAQRPALP